MKPLSGQPAIAAVPPDGTAAWDVERSCLGMIVESGELRAPARAEAFVAALLTHAEDDATEHA